jgi:hypothetical protein
MDRMESTNRGYRPDDPQSIRRIDHIVIEVGRPERLTQFFVETLSFPVIWPLNDYGRYTCSGVFAGNTVLEILKFNAFEGSVGTPADLLGYPQGLALEPHDLEKALFLFDRSRIPYGTPYRHRSLDPEGNEEIRYVNVDLPGLIEPPRLIFMCDYNARVKLERQKKVAQFGAISSRSIGMLGVRSVSLPQMVPARLSSMWSTLFGRPSPSDPFAWEIGGITVGLESKTSETAGRIFFETESLDRAQEFLKSAAVSMTRVVSAGRQTLIVDPSETEGLNLLIQEGDSSRETT